MIPENTAKILIVEDEKDIRLLLVNMLELEGLNVDSACSGNTGFECASVINYACIVSDLMMPDGTGLDLLKKLRLHKIQTPVLFFTGYADKYTKEILDEKNTKIFNKPREMTELITEIKKYFPDDLNP